MTNKPEQKLKGFYISLSEVSGPLVTSIKCVSAGISGTLHLNYMIEHNVKTAVMFEIFKGIVRMMKI